MSNKPRQTGVQTDHVSTVEPKAEFRQVEVEILLGQSVKCSKYKSLCIANHHMQPMQQTCVRIVNFRLMFITKQAFFITAVSVCVDGRTLLNGGLCKFGNTLLAHILCCFQFQKQRLHSYFPSASIQPCVPLQDGHTKPFGQRFFARYSWQAFSLLNLVMNAARVSLFLSGIM